MIRKRLAVSALILSIILVSSPGRGQCPTPDGDYFLDGKFGGKANLPRLVTLAVKLPDLATVGTIARFDASGAFSLLLPMLSEDPVLTGFWAMVPATGCPTAFTVDSDLDSLNDELAPYGIEAIITNRSFGGILQNDGSIKGKLNFNISVRLLRVELGTITMTSSFAGVLSEVPASNLSTGRPSSDPSEQKSSKRSSILADLILKILKKIPLK